MELRLLNTDRDHGNRAFLAEISSLGRLKHKNLVSLRGWCKRDKQNLILIYDYLENGSLDKRIFDYDEMMILYLHEGWESKVLHRDIKASNVLLDKDMNARLGDFGLARLYNHRAGYMAPEVIKTGRSSTKTDVFSFGILVLEVVCERRPIENGKPNLLDWLYMLIDRGELRFALDDRLKVKGGYSDEEVERVLKFGLECAHPDAKFRPTMR